MEAALFWHILKEQNVNFYSGVPDSTFHHAYDALFADPDITYVPAVREDVALGIASAAYFAGKRGGVVLQNSGIGNIVNALTSFSLVYRVPVLLIVGWRGYGGPPNDAPEHWIMGPRTTQFFDLMEIPCKEFEPANFEVELDGLLNDMDKRSVPGALIVRSGLIT